MSIKRKISLFIIITFLLLILAYVTSITNIPNNFIIFQGDNFEYKGLLGLQAKSVSISTNKKLSDEYKDTQESQENNSDVLVDTSQQGTVELQISAFGVPVKDVSVSILPKTKVIPAGNAIGVKLYTNGVLIIGKSTIEGEDSNLYKPYENTGIQEGDMIVEINNKEVLSTEDLIDIVNSSNGNELSVKYRRGQTINTTSIKPVKTSSNDYKLGLWVRDGTAGVGTLTFYDPESKSFAALGHGITDVDTEKLIEISSGDLLLSKIMSIKKGEVGNPGEIRGSIVNQEEVGKIYTNTSYGIYGKISNTVALNLNKENEMEVASRNEIKTGKAQIMCCLENGQVEKYDIEIQKIFTNNVKDNKSMIIKITDKKLLNLTGGIIQGMSGSPIIQNGKFVGAVTHVLVNDPTRGYAVFADTMINEMRNS